jgi:hypothetical protein
MMQLQHACRDVDQMPVALTGFQRVTLRAGLAQAIGDDAAGRTGTDHDIIRVHGL